MVGRHRDAADGTAVLHGRDAGDHLGLGQAQAVGHRGIGGGNQRQPGLGFLHDAPVDGIERHACTRKPMKYSSSFGNSMTLNPVSSPIARAVRSMPAGESVARTNHMFSAWVRS